MIGKQAKVLTKQHIGELLAYAARSARLSAEAIIGGFIGGSETAVSAADASH